MKRILLFTMIIVNILLFMLPVCAKETDNKKVKKTYYKYLQKNESLFEVEEGDWYKRNTEKKNSVKSYIIADINSDGVLELITYHITGYKMGYVNIYRYKDNKIKRVKCSNNKEENYGINVDCNAAGRYEIYVCNKNHLHIVWTDERIGKNEQVYRISKKGKIYKKYEMLEDSLIIKYEYYKNSKKITKKEYYSAIKKCKKNKELIENVKENRK
ncbi:hypothetical protein SAMN02745111_01017 [Eubacterium uniforme]|uniref:Repeat domain-containing protein n=1 Tax=Eubacterium uniforme TaxID=39495 RepID=A0A1T4VJE5_9FIRM|nr:hypothetical protein [Eubacterium uniforme]SKA64701.1 hypothetical protein SAMN02745111_01017 [Eubacterium uniforme]